MGIIAMAGLLLLHGAAAPGDAGAVYRETDPAGSELVCKRTLQPGSLYIRKRICLRRDEWDEARDGARTEAKRFQEARSQRRYNTEPVYVRPQGRPPR